MASTYLATVPPKNIIHFQHPLTGDPLRPGTNGDLIDSSGRVLFRSQNGCYDFVVDSESKGEREWHDQQYADGGWWGRDLKGKRLDDLNLESLWYMPAAREYLASFGDVRGKDVLLIGNGGSPKEFLLVQRGARVVFTDLSLAGCLAAKKLFEDSRLSRVGDCEFYAANAYHLPFEDNGFDLVCADAMIHHLQDTKCLFRQIRRVLKPGGIFRCSDTGVSSIWQWAKKGPLHRMQKRGHAKLGISPEDLVATEKGGYTLQEMWSVQKAVGFREVYYKRISIFDYLVWRAYCYLRFPVAFRKPAQLLDRLLRNTWVMRTQGISLILGFSK